MQREKEAAEEAGAKDDLAARLAELRTREKEQRQLGEAACFVALRSCVLGEGHV